MWTVIDLRALQRQAPENRSSGRALEGLERRFYASFSHGDEDSTSIRQEKKLYGKQRAACKDFNVSDIHARQDPEQDPQKSAILWRY